MLKFLDNALVNKIYTLSVTDEIPIVRDQTAELIVNLIRDNHYSDILEIGTAYGYSSSIMATFTSAKIISLEKNHERYLIANNFLNEVKSIEVLNEDCFLYTPQQKFDLIFVDGPKKKQIDILNHYKHYLKPNGKLFIDNIYLKKITAVQNPNPQQMKIIVELKKFVDHITKNEEFNCTIYDIDDGVAILEWK